MLTNKLTNDIEKILNHPNGQAMLKFAIAEIKQCLLVVHWIPKLKHFKTCSVDERWTTGCGHDLMDTRGDGSVKKHEVTCKNCLRIINK